MSQRNVERLVGRLVLDEELRQRFCADRHATVSSLVAEGVELTAVELEALRALDPIPLEVFAQALDPRLQKVSLASSGAEPSRLAKDGSP